MSDFFVSVGKAKVLISRDVFSALVGLVPHVKEYVAYKRTIKEGHATIKDIKEIATRSDIPYPLFFAPQDKVNKQIEDYKKNIEERMPGKDEMVLSHRGKLQINEAKLIINDLSRKQEFLKNYVLEDEKDNHWIGFIRKRFPKDAPTEEVAAEIRSYFEIDLQHMAKISKARCLDYLCAQVEKKNIFVSLSSYNFMPQNLNRDVEFSGICIKDKKFPYIFVNTRDGDEDPLILETEGRQMFTVISMLVSTGMNIFAFSAQKGAFKHPFREKIFEVTGAVLVPENRLKGIKINSVEEVQDYATQFKVTPSMLLMRLKGLKIISGSAFAQYRDALKRKLLAKQPTQKNQPLPQNGYGKYNGARFSRETLAALKNRKINLEQAKNILFRRGKKMDNALWKEYRAKFN